MVFWFLSCNSIFSLVSMEMHSICGLISFLTPAIMFSIFSHLIEMRIQNGHSYARGKRLSCSSFFVCWFKCFRRKQLNRCGNFACVRYDIIGFHSSITAQSNTILMNIQLNQSFEMVNALIFGYFSPLSLSIKCERVRFIKSVVIPLKNDGATNPVSYFFLQFMFISLPYIVYFACLLCVLYV